MRGSGQAAQVSYSLPWPRVIEDTLFPSESEPWTFEEKRSTGLPGRGKKASSRHQSRALAKLKPWAWPNRRICFFSDLHADPQAFLRSLEAAGLVRRRGKHVLDFDLERNATRSMIIIGGDCFAKGPNTLRLLDMIDRLRALGMETVLLAGNHDVHTLTCLAHAGQSDDPRRGHLLVRKGKKSIPLLKEVFDEHPTEWHRLSPVLHEEEARAHLFPSEAWCEAFSQAARKSLPKSKISAELDGIRDKAQAFEALCRRHGLSLAQVATAVELCRQLFIKQHGRYAWFFDRMALVHRKASFVFVHAGLDDTMARRIVKGGMSSVNKDFRTRLRNDPVALSDGTLGNAFNTKYRGCDRLLSRRGVFDLREAGVNAVMHGHRRSLEGQRLVLRQGLPHFECDATVDLNTRRAKGLGHPGGAVTIIEKCGVVRGISTDHDYVKEFDPRALGARVTRRS